MGGEANETLASAIVLMTKREPIIHVHGDENHYHTGPAVVDIIRLSTLKQIWETKINSCLT